MNFLRGPRLGTKLLLLGMVLLVIPYLGTQSLRAMKNFLFDGQAQAQMLTAQGLATLLHNRDELFNDLPPSLEGYAELPLYPLERDIQLDAFTDEWRAIGVSRKSQSFTGNGIYFQLVLGERDGNIYGLIDVNDSTPVGRDPGVLRLNHADHLRLYFRDVDGIEKRVQLLWNGSGNTTAYYMDNEWNYAINDGKPDFRIQGYIQRRSEGYTLEFKLPLNILSDRQLGIAVADSWQSGANKIDALTGTFPVLDSTAYNLMVLRSPQLEDILNSISSATTSRVWILDRDRRVRAISGSLDTPTSDEQSGSGQADSEQSIFAMLDYWNRFIEWITGRFTGMPEGDIVDYDPTLTYSREDNALQSVLAGSPTEYRRQSLDGKAKIITAAYPIVSTNEVIGAVLLEQSTHHILELQSESLERVATLTLISLFAVIVAMLLFSARLAWRIRRLGQETSTSIDDYGRLQGLRISRDLKAGDEIGDLARNINLALEKLNQHQGFLANIPRTLRHEINNPLNTISTSLDNLEHANAGMSDCEAGNGYLASARRGLMRISEIVGKLADAASLEEALKSEEMFEFDLAAMLSAYVQNQQKLCPEHPIQLNISEQPLLINGSDIHIEQLLDKLLDNARDFSADNAAITVNLFSRRDYCELQVINRGPLLEKQDIPYLFQMMHSKRHDKTPGHFGLGLYVARVIAEQHNGAIKAENLADRSGPCFRVRLPLP